MCRGNQTEKNKMKRNIIPMKIMMMKMTIGKRPVIIKSSRTHSNQEHNDDQIAYQNHEVPSRFRDQ